MLLAIVATLAFVVFLGGLALRSIQAARQAAIAETLKRQAVLSAQLAAAHPGAPAEWRVVDQPDVFQITDRVRVGDRIIFTDGMSLWEQRSGTFMQLPRASVGRVSRRIVHLCSDGEGMGLLTVELEEDTSVLGSTAEPRMADGASIFSPAGTPTVVTHDRLDGQAAAILWDSNLDGGDRWVREIACHSDEALLLISGARATSLTRVSLIAHASREVAVTWPSAGRLGPVAFDAQGDHLFLVTRDETIGDRVVQSLWRVDTETGASAEVFSTRQDERTPVRVGGTLDICVDSEGKSVFFLSGVNSHVAVLRLPLDDPQAPLELIYRAPSPTWLPTHIVECSSAEVTVSARIRSPWAPSGPWTVDTRTFQNLSQGLLSLPLPPEPARAESPGL
jgi:hypothetical protein